MTDYPEDLLQALMGMTGKSRKQVEDMLEKTISEMSHLGQLNKVKPAKSDKKYTEESYPHFQPARNVLKYTLRVTLSGIKPAIWRKFVVPSNITLRHLGDLILDLMGWGNYHLNQFYKGNDYFMPAYQREESQEDYLVWDCNNHNQEDYTIADLLIKKNQIIHFEYDFGDSWIHDIRLSSIEEYESNEPRVIRFINGKGGCPPEDCGSIWGYEDLLRILDKRKAGKRLTSEERGMLDWAGWDKDYDPEFLDCQYCEQVAESYN